MPPLRQLELTPSCGGSAFSSWLGGIKAWSSFGESGCLAALRVGAGVSLSPVHPLASGWVAQQNQSSVAVLPPEAGEKGMEVGRVVTASSPAGLRAPGYGE